MDGVVFALLVCFWGFCCVVLSVCLELAAVWWFCAAAGFWLVFGVFFANGLLVFSASWVVIACVCVVALVVSAWWLDGFAWFCFVGRLVAVLFPACFCARVWCGVGFELVV